MNYHEAVIVDFARRTRANLDFVEAAKGRGENVFEVTQLANSLLGLLVFPQQRYMNSIPDTPLAELVNQGWPKIQTTSGALPEENLHQLLRMLRNSIAPCNVEFMAESEGLITGIKVWNTKSGKKTWQAELSLDDLRTIVMKFIELIESDKVSG